MLVITHAGGSPIHGPNMRWYYLGQALRDMGVEVEIVSSSSFHKYIAPPVVQNPVETEVVNGLKYHWIKTRPYHGRGFAQVRNQAEFVGGCYRAVKYLSDRQPDFVVASSPHPLVVFPAQAVAKRAGARFIYEVRDLWPEVLIELGGFRRWHPYILALGTAEHYGVKHSDLVISVKPGDGEYFQDRYDLSETSFAYVPNGFLAEKTQVAAPEALRELRDRYSFIIGYTGALSAYYGLEHLLELARLLQHRSVVGFVIVGKGDLAEALRKGAEQSGLKNLHLVGAVPKVQVGPILETFDACYVGLADLEVHRYGISCNKIYEYMFTAKPIIGSYRAGYDPVADADCGFVAAPGDYAPLVRGIGSLIEQPELAREMGERGREYFKRNHDFKVIARRLNEMLFPSIETKSQVQPE